MRNLLSLLFLSFAIQDTPKPDTRPKDDKKEELKIAVTQSGYDNMGQILTKLGYKYKDIKLDDLKDFDKIKDFNIIFINCNSQCTDALADKAKDAIKEYVTGGGALYASDYAYIFVQKAFPKRITFPDNPKTGESGQLEAVVTDTGLSNFMDKGNFKVNYNASSWVLIKDVDKACKVYMRKKTKDDEKPGMPLMVSFTESKGYVIYTTFHNHAQTNEFEDLLLKYLVVNPATFNLSKIMEDLIKGSKYSLIQTGPGLLTKKKNTGKFKFNIKEKGRLKVVLGWQEMKAHPDGKIILKVIGPDGKIAVEKESNLSPITLTINDAEGEYSCEIEITKADDDTSIAYVISSGIKK